MKDSYNMVLILIGMVVAVVLFFGFISIVRETFKPSADQIQTMDSSKLQTQQERRMDEIKKKEKRLAEEQKQRILDARH